MTRYFEYAVSEGEGLLTEHYVLAIGSDYLGETSVLMVDFSPDLLNPDCIEISREIDVHRYAEFIAIHGSEVAV